MNLALHQLRLELRRERFALAIYLLILACNLAVVAGWVGSYELSSGGHWSGGSILPVLLILGFWIALAKVVAGSVIADSPARADKFLSTRPLPGSSLITGKVLYILIGAILPAALVEMLALGIAGASGGTILLGGLERFFLVTIVAALIAVFAAHWANAASLLLATAITFGATMILGNVLIESLAPVIDGMESLERPPTFLSLLQGALVCTACLTITAWLRGRHALKVRWLIPAFALFVVVTFLAIGKTPLRIAPYRGTEQAKLDEVNSNTPVRLLGERFRSNNPWSNKPDINLTCQVHPIAPKLPDDWELRWRRIAEQWTSEGTGLKKNKPIDRHPLATTTISHGQSEISWALARTIQGHLAKQVLFHTGNRHYGNTSTSLTTGSLRYTPDHPSVNKQAKLQAELAADAFRWKVIAEFPTKAGAADGDWELASFVSSGSGGADAALVEETFSLQTAGQPDQRTGSTSWRQRLQFALYLPNLDLVWMGESSRTRRAPSLFAAKRFYGTVEFDNHGRLPALDAPDAFIGARLLVLQPEFLGRVVTDWTSSEFALPAEAFEKRNGNGADSRSEPLSQAEFASWFHYWDKIDPNADPAAVRRHLTVLFDQVAHSGYNLQNPQEPAVIHAARFVPRHFELLLSIASDYRSQIFLNAALIQGADDSQRTDILEAVTNYPQLAVVAVARGWIHQSPETAINVLKRGGLYSGDLFASLLSLDRPDLDEFLLESYRQNPSTQSYNRLRQMPRLRSAVEQITRDLWQPGRIVVIYNSIDPLLHLALSQGRAEAFEELFTLLHYYGMAADRNWALTAALSEVIEFPAPLKEAKRRGASADIVKWALTKKAADFVWDPVFRRFVPKTSRTTI